MIIRKESRDDFGCIHNIHRQAFGQDDEGELVERLRASDHFIPELSLVAEENGTIIGHILFLKITISGHHEYGSLVLAPMAVLPMYQRQGIGGKLVGNGLNKAGELGFDAVIVVGHPEYYPRFGFEQASKWGITCPFEVPDEAFMAIELYGGSLAGTSGVARFPKEFGVT